MEISGVDEIAPDQYALCKHEHNHTELNDLAQRHPEVVIKMANEWQ